MHIPITNAVVLVYSGVQLLDMQLVYWVHHNWIYIYICVTYVCMYIYIYIGYIICYIIGIPLGIGCKIGCMIGCIVVL